MIFSHVLYQLSYLPDALCPFGTCTLRQDHAPVKAIVPCWREYLAGCTGWAVCANWGDRRRLSRTLG